MYIFCAPCFRKFFFIFFAFITFIKANAQLHADFESTVQEGCSPIIVHFTNTSTGSPTICFWDLGNGAVSTDKDSASAIYINPGTYTIKLYIKNSSGVDSVIKLNYVTVYENPSVALIADPTEGCLPLSVNFTDSSKPGSGTIASWLWDFGDGITSTLQNPSHIYNISDTFNVTLSVTNSFGCKKTLQQPSLIKIGGLIKSDFSYSYSNACKAPVKVVFNNTSESNKPMSYQWFFGDGAASTEKDPEYTYLTSGNFTVQLIAITSTGCSDTSSQVISVGSAKADFEFTGTCLNTPVIFTDKSTPKPLKEIWDFGDGVMDSGYRVSHVYGSKGTFQVTLMADFGDCADTIKKAIQIGESAQANFTAVGNRNTCLYPVTIQFLNLSKSASNYKWVFSDGTYSSDANPIHIYKDPGKYAVALIAYNTRGCSDTIIKNDFIQIGPPEIEGIQGLPFEGCAPQTLTLKPIIDSSESVATYYWDFGDGTTSNSSKPVHLYQNTGIYNITLAVTTTEGCKDTLFLPGAVSLGNPPKSFFSARPLDACAEIPIQFKDSSKGLITDWLWVFGDGPASTEQNPTHIYTDTGYFDVSLIVSQYKCYDTLTLNNYIYVKPPVAQFTAFSLCSKPFTYTFSNKSIGAKKYLWDFGDGNTWDKQNAIHVYGSPGTFYVSLTAFNDNCSYTKFDTLHIVEENPSFQYEFLSTNFCKYDSVRFSVTNFDSANIQGFQWYFGDGTSSQFDTINSVAYHRYNDAGSYNPILVVTDINNCIDTVNKNIQIDVFGPHAAFSNKAGDCISSTIGFTDESFTDNIHAIKKWIWNYGDSTQPDTLTAPPFKHKFNNAGIFDVSLKVIDENNCFDSVINIAALTITDPVAMFYADTLSCSGSPVQFIDSSIGISMEYNWDFGDGVYSTNPQPQHAYAAEGLYDVKLILKDKYGCMDSVFKTAYIRVANPFAGFVLTDSFFVCPPAKITPANISYNYDNLIWDFGDDNTSSEIMPEHLYTLGGTYLLKLIVQGYGSCYDAFEKPIIVKGPSAKLAYMPFAGCSPLPVSFSAKSENTVRYIWDFGNGVTQNTTDSVINYNYLTHGKFVPQLVVVDSAGCQVPIVNNDTIIVSEVEPKFYTNLKPGTCDSTLYLFTDSSELFNDTIIDYKWNFGDGDSSVNKDPAHYYTKPGVYNTFLNITTKKGCQAFYELPVSVLIDSMPQVFATIPDSVCVNAPASFTASVANNSANNFSWKWDFGNGDIAFSNDTIYSYVVPQNYDVSVSATSANGCTNTIKNALLAMPLPPVDAGPDSVICKGDVTNLAASGANKYTWLANTSLSCLTCSNPVATPLNNTTYFLTGANLLGCKAYDSVNIWVKQPADVSIVAPDTICTGTTIQLKATGAELYNWQPASSVTNSTDSITSSTPLTTTIFSVIGKDAKGCFTDTASSTVNVFPIPTVQLQDSIVTIEAGNEYQINAKGSGDIISWKWQPLTDISCSNCSNPIVKPTSTTTYQVNVHNIAGCSAAEQIKVVVLCKGQNLFIPNTFSPNGDGMNDYFYPRAKGIMDIKLLRIFNRWGTIVYERANFPPNQQSYGWNGTYNGKPAQSDVYVFVIEVLCSTGETISSKGNVTLLR